MDQTGSLRARPVRGPSWRPVVVEIAIGLLVSLLTAWLLTATTGRPALANASMAPGIPEGTRLWLERPAEPRRGDVVLITPDARWHGAQPDEPGALARLARALRLAAPEPGSRMVTRVIGVPGDEVRCCTGGGLVVNGTRVPAAVAGHSPFRVVLPHGTFFVATDVRSRASSQCYLSRLGEGALVPRARVLGRVAAAGWPWARVDLGPSAAPYTGIAPGQPPPSAPVIEAAKDPTC